jgi:hypothetical protein
MRTNKFACILLVIALLMPVTFSACSANPTALSPVFNEISLEEALNKFPDLKVEIYPYNGYKAHEGRNFFPLDMSLEDVMAKRAAERETPLRSKDDTLDDKALSYSVGNLQGRGEVIVKLGGKTIFSAPYGDDAPVNPVGGHWVLEGKWILELIQINTRTVDNTVYTETRGDIIIDGKSMNERFGYDESFAFQPLAENFFYFYKKDGKIGFFFDGQHIQTDFTAIPHYACCSGAANNPFHYQNMISFFSGKGEENLYVEIGVYPSH